MVDGHTNRNNIKRKWITKLKCYTILLYPFLYLFILFSMSIVYIFLYKCNVYNFIIYLFRTQKYPKYQRREKIRRQYTISKIIYHLSFQMRIYKWRQKLYNIGWTGNRKKKMGIFQHKNQNVKKLGQVNKSQRRKITRHIVC